MDKKPNVFPVGSQQPQQQQPQPQQPNVSNTQVFSENDKVYVDSEYESQRMQMANEVYSSSMNETGMSAVQAMRQRTEEQIRLRDEMLRKNAENIQNYQNQMETATQQPQRPTQPAFQPQMQQPQMQQSQPQMQQPQPQVIQANSEPKSPIANMSSHQQHVEQLSQPQYNASFDVIPLPSEGKLYKNGKPSVKVAYMTTADENILTSPNLLASGEFLEILINRKLLEPNLRYKDLHVGDRNAIMIWLRATSYGEMYPVTMYDEDNNSFDYEIDLTQLKTIKLSVEPDAEGYFDFYLPVAKTPIKFKLLTVGDLDDIDKLVQEDEQNESPVVNINTYRLEKQIVDVGGNRDKNFIRGFIQNLRVRDAKELRQYMEKIDCGIDLNVNVTTPRGGSITTFLPLNFKFFWPDFPL